jgi:hypothetical protein
VLNSLQKHRADGHAFVRSFSAWCPYFGYELHISNGCHENDRSYVDVGVDPEILFGLNLGYWSIKFSIYNSEIKLQELSKFH